MWAWIRPIGVEQAGTRSIGVEQARTRFIGVEQAETPSISGVEQVRSHFGSSDARPQPVYGLGPAPSRLT